MKLSKIWHASCAKDKTLCQRWLLHNSIYTKLNSTSKASGIVWYVKYNSIKNVLKIEILPHYTRTPLFFNENTRISRLLDALLFPERGLVHPWALHMAVTLLFSLIWSSVLPAPLLFFCFSLLLHSTWEAQICQIVNISDKEHKSHSSDMGIKEFWICCGDCIPLHEHKEAPQAEPWLGNFPFPKISFLTSGTNWHPNIFSLSKVCLFFCDHRMLETTNYRQKLESCFFRSKIYWLLL